MPSKHNREQVAKRPGWQTWRTDVNALRLFEQLRLCHLLNGHQC